MSGGKVIPIRRAVENDPDTTSWVCWDDWHHECMVPGCTCWCHAPVLDLDGGGDRG